MRILNVAACLLAAAGTAHAQGGMRATTQTPLMFSSAIRPPSTMDPTLRVAVQERAGKYPLDGFAFFGRDSVILVFIDSTYTGAGKRAGTWMFGPPVTAAEAAGCPREKVLGRQVARALFRALGRPAGLRTVRRGKTITG